MTPTESPDVARGQSSHGQSSQGRCLAGRYRLTEVIGSGGAGTVWAAVDEVLGREVAVKDVVAPPWVGEGGRDALRERTMREARATARIGHPNVVTVYDVVEEDGRPWIVMQLVHARSLSQVLRDEGPRTPREVAEIGLQLLGALHAAHELGIMHRDVKPSNVLVDDEGHAVLTDFGIASIEGDAALTGTGVLVGAPAYIPPERVQGSPAVPASDMWSLGATLYTAVEGRPPYQREGALSTVAAAVQDDPDPMVRAGSLTPLLCMLLHHDPAQRPTALEAERILREIITLPTPTTAVALAVAAAATGTLDGLETTTAAAPLPPLAAAAQPEGARRFRRAAQPERARRSGAAERPEGGRRLGRPSLLAAAMLAAAGGVLLALLLLTDTVPGLPTRGPDQPASPAEPATTDVPSPPSDRSGPGGVPAPASGVPVVDSTVATTTELPASSPQPSQPPSTSQPAPPPPTATSDPVPTQTSPPTTQAPTSTASAAQPSPTPAETPVLP